MASNNKIGAFVSKVLKSPRRLIPQSRNALLAERTAVDQWRFQDLKEEISKSQEWRFQDLKSTLNQIDEWRFQDLISKISSSDEWRFKDLKLYLNDGLPRDTTFTLEQSLHDLNNLGDSKKSAIAIVSVLPPASTGIARFTAKTFAHARHSIDFYTPVQSGFEYLLQKEHNRSSVKQSPILTLDALPHGLSVRDYAAVLFVLGNSDHHIPVMRVLRRMRDMLACPPISIEIHDSVLLNLCAKTVQFENRSLRESIQAHSRQDLSSLNWLSAEAGDHSELASLGYTGFPVLLRDVPIHSLIFHSEPAREIVLRDWPEFAREQTAVLFHPVFEPFTPRLSYTREYDAGIKIGTFGVPSRGKQTHLVIEAFYKLRESHPGSTLIIAGYGAGDFVRDENINLAGISVYDSPDNEKLLQLMKDVDAAVQLRAKNTGESSGIVPQLLACDTPCICTPIGAFECYINAVTYSAVNSTSDELAKLIAEVADSNASMSDARRQYVEDHTPQKFCETLDEFFQKIGVVTSAHSKEEEVQSEEQSLSDASQLDFGSHWDDRDPTPQRWHAFEDVIRAIGAAEDPYIKKHTRRYRHTLAALEGLEHISGGSCLEVGTSWIFSVMLRRYFGYSQVDVTDFDPTSNNSIIERNVSLSDGEETFKAFNVNLEQDTLPADDDTYDLILCCEVLEHMDVDPMFMLSELNRVAKNGCRLLLTTPNTTSGRNVMKILNGYAPHFFMQYHKDRSPYRHNLEYAPDQVINLLNGAGFVVESIWTANTFEAPDIPTENFLNKNNFPTSMRGDNMFVSARKIGSIVDRYPSSVYV